MPIKAIVRRLGVGRNTVRRALAAEGRLDGLAIARRGDPLVSRSMQRATDRLLLRPLRHGDEKDVLAYRSRQDVCRYLTNGPLDESTVEAFVAARTSATHIVKDGDRILLAVELEGLVIGDVRLRAGELRDRQGEVGWVFNPDFHGRGYATEAARDLVRLAFEDLGMHRVWAQLDPRNGPSARVCQRLGMRQEGHLRQHSWLNGEWGDLVLYGILEDEWPRATPWPLRQAPGAEAAVQPSVQPRAQADADATRQFRTG